MIGQMFHMCQNYHTFVCRCQMSVCILTCHLCACVVQACHIWTRLGCISMASRHLCTHVHVLYVHTSRDMFLNPWGALAWRVDDIFLCVGCACLCTCVQNRAKRDTFWQNVGCISMPSRDFRDFSSIKS